ncbi:MAG: stage II sporulation protein P [Oscillospiraceae bacterium]|nr:stage II sporulation protein P [Oscillospiraceae bacterium]
MHRISRMMISAMAASGLWLMSAGQDMAVQEAGRMKNVILLTPAPREIIVETPGEPAVETLSALSLPEMEPGRPEEALFPEASDNVLETTIEGGMSIKNETGYFIDPGQMLREGPGISLSADGPQILIIHTHSSEAYTQAGLDRYLPSDTNRTEDTQFNIVRIGDELAEILTDCGLKLIHDRGIYDYPSYTGSYTRSGEAIAEYLESYPSIKIVLDIHRDALGSEGVVYKTMAEEEGVCASQIMLLCGSDDSGLEHPDWRSNMGLALYLQSAAVQQHPTLMRPISLVRERYNQHLTPGSLIIEVGSSGNTLQEALAGVRLFGRAIGPALMELVQ